MYTRLKDKTPLLKQSNLVYCISCECGTHYVGQTKQYLGKRINQHKLDCRNHNEANHDKTALSSHHFETRHNFRFDEVKILDKETNFKKRNLSEMIFINLHNTINLRTDTLGLSNIYSNLLNKYRERNQIS